MSGPVLDEDGNVVAFPFQFSPGGIIPTPEDAPRVDFPLHPTECVLVRREGGWQCVRHEQMVRHIKAAVDEHLAPEMECYDVAAARRGEHHQQ